MRIACFILPFALFALRVDAQRIASIEVRGGGFYAPVTVSLDPLTNKSAGELILKKVEGKKVTDVPFQVTEGSSRELTWLHQPSTSATRYELHAGISQLPDAMQIMDDGKDLTIQSGKKNLLRYRYAPCPPPTGADSAYTRSAFIHPLWSPHGQELTRIQPPDHFHHYGIWNPWTHVKYRGDTIDFWNIGGKSGTVQFAGFASRESGPVFAQYEALHAHKVLRLNKKSVSETALDEMQTIRVYQPTPDFYIVDMINRMSPAGQFDFEILQYRYAGLGWRTTGQWDRNNSNVLTSELKTRKDADGTKARWCMVQGLTDGENAGVILMSHPANFNHPEPLRIWPENQYDRGDMFASFSTTKDKDWILKAGKAYVLRYRFVVFNGPVTKELAEQAWRDYAYPSVRIVKG